MFVAATEGGVVEPQTWIQHGFTTNTLRPKGNTRRTFHLLCNVFKPLGLFALLLLGAVEPELLSCYGNIVSHWLIRKYIVRPTSFVGLGDGPLEEPDTLREEGPD